MSLDSAATLAEIKASYADSASYHESNSAAKARDFITACRLLLLHLPRRAAKGGGSGSSEIELEVRLLAEEIDEAKRFLTEYHVAAAPRRTFSLENFRD